MTINDSISVLSNFRQSVDCSADVADALDLVLVVLPLLNMQLSSCSSSTESAGVTTMEYPPSGVQCTSQTSTPFKSSKTASYVSYTKNKEKRGNNPSFKNSYKAWTPEEDQRLRNMFETAGWSVDGLAKAHGRTKGAIVSRLCRMGLLNLDGKDSQQVKEQITC